MKEESFSLERSRADELVQSGFPAEAVPIYRKLAADNPDEDSHLLALAWALYDRGETAEAVVCFEQLFVKELARKLFTGFAYDELVRIYRAAREWDSLFSVCERAAAAQPEDVGLLRTLGDALIAAGRAGDAISVFEKLTGLETDGPENWCALGDAWLAAGNAEKAEASYNRAADIDSTGAIIFFSRLADGLLRAGYHERAQAVWGKCIALRGDEPFFWMGIGDCFVSLGNQDAAMEACLRAIGIRPSSAGEFWNRLGNSFTRAGLHSNAASAFANAVAAEPGNSLYSLRLTESYAAVRGETKLPEETEPSGHGA